MARLRVAQDSRCRPTSDVSIPRTIVHLAHGMGEHSARYRRFAQALVDAGYVMYANDHRGHGRTAGTTERHGNLCPAGWRGLVDDLGALNAHARAEHPDTPLVMFGHSMRSFALQQYLVKNSANADAAILSGTSAIAAKPARASTRTPMST